MLALDRARWTRYVLLAMLVVIVASGAVAACALFFLVWTRAERLFFSAVTCGGFAVLALVCAFCLPRIRSRAAPLLGILVAAVALGVSLVALWHPGPWRVRAAWDHASFISMLWALAFPYFCVLELARLRGRAALVRRVAEAATIPALVLVSAAVVGYRLPRGPGLSDDVAVALLLVIEAVGAAVVFILHWLESTRPQEPTVTTPLVLGVTCPRCALQQDLPAGRSRCRGCGLGFQIEIREERCPNCGYVLYRLTSENCPECGMRIFPRAPASRPLDPSALLPGEER